MRLLKDITNAELMAEASKYASVGEFKAAQPRLFREARSRRLVKNPKLEPKPKPKSGPKHHNMRWTHEAIALSALRCSTLKEFRCTQFDAYHAALRNGILEEVCAHMDSTRIIYMWRARDEYFNGLKVYRIGATSRGASNFLSASESGTGFKGRLMCMVERRGDAREFERTLLGLGVNPGYTGIPGASKFRALTDSELETALKMFDNEG
jgi:hypothetical protein